MQKQLLIGILVLAVTVKTSAKHNDPVTVSVSDYYPYNNPLGQGLASDIYRAAFFEVHRTVKVLTIPTERAAKMFLQRKVDAFSSGDMFLTPTQKKLTTSTPSFKVLISSFFLKPAPHGDSQLNTLADIKDYRVGSVFNSPLIEVYTQNKLNFIPIKHPRQMIFMAKEGRLDYFNVTLFSGVALIAKYYPEQGNQFGYHSWQEMDSSLTFLKNNERSKKLQREYQKGLREIINNGKYLEIHEKYWGPGNVPKQILPQELKPYGVDRKDFDPLIHRAHKKRHRTNLLPEQKQ